MSARLATYGLTLVTLLVAAPEAARHADISTSTVVGKAATYVSAYQEQLTYLVADETYEQRLFRGTEPSPSTRLLKSEVFFMFVPGERAWMTIRDVAEIDGNPVEHRNDLRTLLRDRSFADVAMALRSQNARFNLGRIVRTFNEPTVSLLPLDQRHRPRFSFKRTRVSRAGEATIVTLAFTEKERPTLIRLESGGPVYAKGELDVEAETGRVRRATLHATAGSIRADSSTEYARDERLDVWVPQTFTERYEQTRGEREVVTGTARYTNYRRFEVTGRIK